MAKLIEKNVAALVAAAITSSTNNHKIVKEAATNAILFAAQHGRCNLLSELFNKVSGPDAEGMRLFIVNMNAKFGGTIVTDNGQERKISFLKFNRKEGQFSINNTGTEETVQAAKICREAVEKAGIAGLMELTFGKVQAERGDDMARVFDEDAFEKAMANLLTKAARNGISSATLSQYNKLLDKEHQVDVARIASEAEKTAKDAINRANRLISKFGGKQNEGDKIEEKAA